MLLSFVRDMHCKYYEKGSASGIGRCRIVQPGTVLAIVSGAQKTVGIYIRSMASALLLAAKERLGMVRQICMLKYWLCSGDCISI
jgi:hypothetical protein